MHCLGERHSNPVGAHPINEDDAALVTGAWSISVLHSKESMSWSFSAGEDPDTGARCVSDTILKSVTHQASSNEAKKSPPLDSPPVNGDKQLL